LIPARHAGVNEVFLRGLIRRAMHGTTHPPLLQLLTAVRGTQRTSALPSRPCPESGGSSDAL